MSPWKIVLGTPGGAATVAGERVVVVLLLTEMSGGPSGGGRFVCQSPMRFTGMTSISATPYKPPTAAPRILVVEDEEKTRLSLAEGLGLEDWQVATAATSAQALMSMGNGQFDLIVLDWMLPDHDGLEFLQQLRASGLHTPVLMLTARSTLDDRVKGLESGADDYLPKPFAFAELIARCRALLRRPLMQMGRLLHYADLQLDTRARIANRGGQQIPLTPREVDILEYLMRYQGQIVTREMLERDVWKQPSRVTSLDNVIDVQMMRLRRKVDPDGAERLLHTLRGVGYRFGKELA